MSAESIRAKIAMARKLGWSDGEILKVALANVYGATERRELVVEWGNHLGLDPSDALQLARAEHLIPTSAPPRSSRSRHKPPRKT
jgi:hypothetical protein